jgi:hypothetical protein
MLWLSVELQVYLYILVTSALDDWYSNKFRGNCIEQTIGGGIKIL